MVIKSPWLYLPAHWSHKLSPLFLHFYDFWKSQVDTPQWGSFTWKNLHFSNPLGIAGGVDKDAEYLQSWWKLGAGFLEIGTITPQAQKGHSGKVIDRNNVELSVWNRMGFPSQGVAQAISQLKKQKHPYPTPLFANVGKNKLTSNTEASRDYISSMKQLSPFVDGFVLNISSPNTAGLRELLLPQNLKNFLEPVLQETKELEQPVLLKISPDITNDELKSILDISLQLSIDGWILTNTTNFRESHSRYPTEGGVSGAPLADTSKKLLKSCVEHLGPDRKEKLIISSGGVLTPEDVFERLNMGAQLVQVYAALIYQGPFFFRLVADKRQASR